jgi:uncharacterized RDD family membrane protein YckC
MEGQNREPRAMSWTLEPGVQPPPATGPASAGIKTRFTALLIDAGMLMIALIVLAVLAMDTGLIYDSAGVVRPEARTGVELLWLVLVVAYFTCCWALFRGTFGQWARGLHVQRMSDGDALGWGASFLRTVVMVVCVWTVVVGILAAIVAIFQPARRSLVDLAAGSVVVKKN